MIKATYRKKVFNFLKPATTSRGTLLSKISYFIFLYDDSNPYKIGVGECSILPGLSYDDCPDFEQKLNDICQIISKGYFNYKIQLYNYPSIQFALDTAYLDLQNKGSKILFPSEFTSGNDFLKINGLIWMGSRTEMLDQINEKLSKGFSCLKLKVGLYNFEDEFNLIKSIRKQYPESELEIRLDANGAYTANVALEYLTRFADLDIHSIEQPIMPAQLEEMAQLCALSPLAIALDEELIGKHPMENKKTLLEIIKPQYIILKPGLLGGFKSCEEWIKLADERKIGWWVTSALESNLGLNAIAQWTYNLAPSVIHGLGTGLLYSNNLQSPLGLDKDRLYFFPSRKWNLTTIQSNKDEK